MARTRMATLQRSATLAALLLASAFCLARGTITASHVRSDDRQLIPLSQGFGFAVSPEECVDSSSVPCPGGHVHLELSNLTVHLGQNASKNTDLNRMGFFVSDVEPTDMLDALAMAGGACVLDHDLVPSTSVLIRLSDSRIRPSLQSGKPASTSWTQRITDSFDDVPYLYLYVYFGNCEPTPVSFDMNIKMYNIDSKGKINYLSVGDSALGIVYWVMFSFFTVTTAAWFVHIYKNRSHTQRIHLLMGALGVFKALTLMTQAGMNHYVALTGSPDGWNIAYYIFTFFRGILFFTVIVLIGTGWSYMKPFLGDREKRILMLIIPLQVFANIAIIVMDEESPAERDWFTWWDVFRLVDIICCCAILFPIVWSIKNLREAAQTDGKAARSLEKLILFRQFYVTVVVYVYFSRIVVYLLESTPAIPHQYAWVSVAADELATLAFFVWTAVSFRPHEANPYLRLPVADSEVEMK